MPVELKTANHICNVVRRKIQDGFPDLYLYYLIHGEGSRNEAFQREKHNISDHPTGPALVEFLQSPQADDILIRNRSHFSTLAFNISPGFLGFFKNESFLAFCFINHDRFSNEENLKNHALHLAWQSIETYEHLTKNKPSPTFSNHKNIFQPNYEKAEQFHINLKADIFSASIQALQNKKDALSVLANQRIHDTITMEKGFFAEKFAFPVCLDTLEFIFKNNLTPYKKHKKLSLAASHLTHDAGKMFDETAIEQWKSFSLPAQEMAWNGHSPETILGAAIYTSENTYAQSIADMIAERMKIQPETLTNFNNYNPFTADEANERQHKKQCKELIRKILAKIHKRQDYEIIVGVARKQNIRLENHSTMGWCVPALLATANLLVYNYEEDIDSPQFRLKMEDTFLAEIENLPWETLKYLSRKIFEHRRNGAKITQELLNDITSEDEEFSTIYNGLAGLKLFEEGAKSIDFNSSNSDKNNMIDFMSKNKPAS